MAVLTAQELAELRQNCSSESGVVVWDKTQVNTALQTIEDWFESNRANLSAAIEAAVPAVFDANAKKRLVKFWLRQKFGRGG